jgi:hypothetical protein
MCGRSDANSFDSAHADESAGDVGRRHEIAARADGTITRHYGRDAAIHQIDQRLHECGANGRGTGRERGYTQQHGGAHNVTRQRQPGGAGKMPHDVVLE